MNSRNQISLIIKWIARISGTLIIVFVLFFLVTDIFGTEESSIKDLFYTKDAIVFICFPLSTIIGLAIAWKYEGLGGLISTAGFICLSIIRPDLASDLLMMSLALPGLLYLVYWILTNKSN